MIVLRWIPNALTTLRIALAAAFPVVPPDWRVAVLGAALFTEYLDGALARRFGWTSRFGRVADPIADRCVFAVVSVTLLVEGQLTWAQLGLLGARDLLVALGALAFAAAGQAAALAKMRPRIAGKLTTALQYAALIGVLLFAALPAPLLAVTLAAGLIASAQYFADFWRFSAFRPPGRTGPHS